MNNSEYIEKALPLLEAGRLEEAEKLLSGATGREPMIHYYRFYCNHSPQELMAAEVSDPEGVYPGLDWDIKVLELAEMTRRPGCYASLYLGNLYYGRDQIEKALNYWQACAGELPLAMVHRNMALTFYFCLGREDLARQAMENACYLDSKDLELYLETDRLYRAMNVDPRERFLRMFPYEKTLRGNERLHLTYIELLYLLGREEQAKAEEEKLEKIRAHKKIAAVSNPAVSDSSVLKASLTEASDAKASGQLSHEEELGMQKKTSAPKADLKLTIDLERGKTELLLEKYRAILLMKEGGKGAEAAAAISAMKQEGMQHLQDAVSEKKIRPALDAAADFALPASTRNQVFCIYQLSLAFLAEGNQEQAAGLATQGLSLDKNHLGLYRIANGKMTDSL